MTTGYIKVTNTCGQIEFVCIDHISIIMFNTDGTQPNARTQLFLNNGNSMPLYVLESVEEIQSKVSKAMEARVKYEPKHGDNGIQTRLDVCNDVQKLVNNATKRLIDTLTDHPKTITSVMTELSNQIMELGKRVGNGQDQQS